MYQHGHEAGFALRSKLAVSGCSDSSKAAMRTSSSDPFSLSARLRPTSMLLWQSLVRLRCHAPDVLSGFPARPVCNQFVIHQPLDLAGACAAGKSLSESWRGCQSRLRQEAALSQVEEQRRSRDAVEAANAANLARLAENDAMVGGLLV